MIIFFDYYKKDINLIILQLIGGLGNQMFQYAFAKALFNHGYDIKLDISAFETYHLHGGFGLDHYDISIPIASKEEVAPCKMNFFTKLKRKLKIPNKKILEEKTLRFQNDLLSPPDSTYIHGYFQSEKYFKEIRADIIQDFTLTTPLSLYSESIKEKVQGSINSASIHIRRGDYVSNAHANNTHGTCSLAYYQQSITLLDSKFDNIHFFIFSDDIEWVKNNLLVKNCTYIENDSSRIPHEDIYLMSLCQHNIIANSSFSWWGAWLNTNNHKIIIAPKIWFKHPKMQIQTSDIVPEDWLRL